MPGDPTPSGVLGGRRCAYDAGFGSGARTATPMGFRPFPRRSSRHVLWGTDSIWWGSPQWQIEALRRFTMPESLMKRFGYRPLTPDVKAQILGVNAARVYGIDPGRHRNPMPPDYLSKLKAAYLDEGPSPSLTQYGWVLEG